MTNRNTAKTHAPPAPEARRARRPSAAKTAQTRKMIVAAGLEAFIERGFSGTRLADIAERAGLGKGTLYLYFPDKEALFEGVVREVIAGPIAQAAAMEPAEGETVRAFLERTIIPLLRDLEASRRADMIRLVIAEASRFPAMASIYRAGVLEPLKDLARRLSARALSSGEATSDAISRFPLLLFSPALVATVWNGAFGKDEPLDAGEMFKAMLELVFAHAPDGSKPDARNPDEGKKPRR